MILVYRLLYLLELGALSGLPGQISNNLDSVTRVVRNCGSFLTVREEHVYFIYLSARDFLVKKFDVVLARSSTGRSLFSKLFPFSKAEVNEGLLASERDGSKESIEPRIKPYSYRGEFFDLRETVTVMSRNSGYASIISK